MFYVVLGGPGSGKGTRSKILSKKLGIPHISTGEILRKVSETDPIIRDKLAKGIHISDDIITELLCDRISQDDCKYGCVIDGYPRNINQAKILDNFIERLGKKLKAAILLEVSDEIIVSRILERKECPKCGRIYGLDLKPKIENLCDDCYSRLLKRSDDTEETLKTRLNLYHSKSQPIIDYYEKKDILVTIDASNNPKRILSVVSIMEFIICTFRRIFKAFKRFIKLK